MFYDNNLTVGSFNCNLPDKSRNYKELIKKVIAEFWRLCNEESWLGNINTQSTLKAREARKIYE